MQELLARVSSRELTEWMAYYALEAEEQKRAQLEAEARAKASRPPRRR